MERYSKVDESKWQSRYSEEFKRKVCGEYLDGSDSRTTIERNINWEIAGSHSG